ncbi:MAG: hypothetical protein JKY81_05710 [Colwellia sp.]|nr:hypothetical protein [Colwellia sp.]
MNCFEEYKDSDGVATREFKTLRNEIRRKNTIIIELQEKLRPFVDAANEMVEFNTDKPPIIHEKHWLELINKHI